MKIVVFGDSYMPVDVFRTAFDRLSGRFELDYVQLEHDPGWIPSTDSERSLRECFGQPEDVTARVGDCDVIVVHGAPVTDEVLAAAPAVRLVACARGGPVNVDVQSATHRAVVVVTTPGKNAESVADLTLAFMVMLARRVPNALRAVADGGRLGVSAFEGGSYMGHDLGGHALGVIGMGRVGGKVTRRALAFGMRVLAFDPHVEVAAVEEAGASFAPMDALLRESDFVSLHARATRDNQNLMGRAQFAAMKPGAYFVNTARETLVDEPALREALESGHLAGAALDVVRPGLGDGRHPLLDVPNVILTPHIAGSTHETLARGAEMLADEIERFAKGQPLHHAVNAASAELARLDRPS
jgi:D-3-phosphoglycerate dehydrogenase / 2-oxoglutarate reductase